MTDRAETCPGGGTSPIPADWPAESEGLPLMTLWPYLSPACKAEVKAALALLRQPAHARAKRLVKMCVGCGSEIGPIVNDELHAGPIVLRGRTTYRCASCRRPGQWRPGVGDG